MRLSSRLFLFSLPFFLTSVLFLLNLTDIIHFHEEDALDLRFRLRGPKPAHADIVLVTIDDASLEALGEWPWPRHLYAAFLNKISSYKPRRIFFDILFSEYSANRQDDQVFAESIQKAGNVILPFYLDEDRMKPVYPLRELAKAAQGLAFVNVTPDSDGRVRRFLPSINIGEQAFYHPAVLMAEIDLLSLRGAPLGATKQSGFQNQIASAAMQPRNDIFLNFPGPLSSFRTISFGEVIRLAGLGEENKLQSLFENTLVIIGHTATATTDLRPTPFMTQAPGVLLQASAVHTLLNGKFLSQPPKAIEFFLLVALSVLVFWAGIRLSPRAGLLVCLSCMLCYLVLSVIVFNVNGLILPFVLPQVLMLLSYGFALFIRFLEVRFQNERIQQELHFAAEIQKSFLPQTLPSQKDFTLAASYHFARQVGGDFYDAWDLDGGKIAFCLGDVSGKGMPAALYMAKAISELRGIPKQGKMPGEVLSALNNHLANGNTTGLFVTLFYAVIDLNQSILYYASAGHEPALFCKGVRPLYALKGSDPFIGVEILDQAKGIPLGSFEGMEYKTASRSLEPGDALLIFSDGAREMRNPAGKEFGLEALKNSFKEALNEPNADEVVTQLMRKLNSFRGNVDSHDDCTLLLIKKSKSVFFSSRTYVKASKGES